MEDQEEEDLWNGFPMWVNQFGYGYRVLVVMGREKSNIKPLLVKFGVALALSFAGFIYSRFRNRRIKPSLPPPPSPRSSGLNFGHLFVFFFLIRVLIFNPCFNHIAYICRWSWFGRKTSTKRWTSRQKDDIQFLHCCFGCVWKRCKFSWIVFPHLDIKKLLIVIHFQFTPTMLLTFCFSSHLVAAKIA